MLGAPKKRPRLSAGSSFPVLLAQCLASGRLNVRGGRTLGALFQLELHLLAFGQGFKTAALNGGMMHEDILAAVGRGNETEALGVVEPLYCSCNHENTSVWLNCDGLQFIPESERGSSCRSNWEGLPNCCKKCAASASTIQEWGLIARTIIWPPERVFVPQGPFRRCLLPDRRGYRGLSLVFATPVWRWMKASRSAAVNAPVWRATSSPAGETINVVGNPMTGPKGVSGEVSEGSTG